MEEKIAQIMTPRPPLEELDSFRKRQKTRKSSAAGSLSSTSLIPETEADAEAVAAVSRSVLPNGQLKPSPFSTIRQGKATNDFTKLRTIEGNNATIDPITGTATIKKGSFSLTIPNYSQLTGLRTSTHQLFDAITVALTVTGAKSPTVVIPLEAYMERRGLKDRKEAKNQVRADLDILKTASITGEEKRGKNTQAYSFVNIADSGEIKRNGDIVFTFGNTFYQMLLGYSPMPYPAQLQTLNSKKNPNSYYLLRKIAEHKYMNSGKDNEDRISVKTLLEASPYLPSYKEVMAGNRNVADRILSPFERDMDALDETLTWNYCHSKGEPLTDEETQSLNYDIFKTLLVQIEWRSYPDQTARLERKVERIEANKEKSKKKKASKKKADKQTS